MTVLMNEKKVEGALQEGRAGTADKMEWYDTEKIRTAGGEKPPFTLQTRNDKTPDVKRRGVSKV